MRGLYVARFASVTNDYGPSYSDARAYPRIAVVDGPKRNRRVCAYGAAPRDGIAKKR